MKYIQNIHIAPITAVVKNAKGAVILTKRFSPARVDKFTGKVVETGFTPLTDEEYKLLNEDSRTFTVYRDKQKLLVEHDELPPEAKTPHEALVDARKEARKSAAQIAALDAEIVQLKAALLDAERRYKDLFDASGSTDSTKLAQELAKVKEDLAAAVAANAKIGEAFDARLAEITKERDALKAEKAEKAGKGGKGKEFD
jgi:hypothetical protein